MTNLNVIKFYGFLGKLKRLRRSGWVFKNIHDPESVADHSFAVAILTMVIAPKFKVDQLNAIKMALIHDLGESVIGDIIISDGIKILNDPDKKVADERKALAKILNLVDS